MTTTKKVEEQPKPARKLATNVHIDGKVYGPGDDVPADVAAKITNESAWAKPES